jgi:hypothetical protein
MSPNGQLLQIADIATAKVIRTIQFPDNVRVQAVNKDSSKIYEPEQPPDSSSRISAPVSC